MNKSVIVLGSTGLVGRHLVQLLLKDSVYKNIILINRKSCGIVNEKVTEIITDFSNFDFMQDVIPVDAIFSCLGTTKKKTPSIEQYEFIEITIPQTIIQRAAIKGKLNAVHLISAVGANENSNNFYLKIKGKVERIIGELEVPRTFLYRPGLIIGDRGNDKRWLEQLWFKLTPYVDKLLKGKSLKYHSITANDIATSMIYNDINVFINGSNVMEYADMKMTSIY